MKKFLGLFLSLALTLSMFSGFALADETDPFLADLRQRLED